MKNMNFRTLESIKAPAELKEKLYAIPERQNKPAAYPMRRLRAAVAAASLVIIAAVSVTVWLSMSGRTPVELLPTADSTLPTEHIGETLPTDSTAQPVQGGTSPSDGANYPTSQNGTAPTAPSASAETRSTSPTQKNTSPTQSNTSPTQKNTSPTQKSTSPTEVRPTERPTVGPTVPAIQNPTSEPIRPTDYYPTDPPCVPPVEPTETPNPTEAPTDPAQPVEPTLSPEVRRRVNLTTGELKRRLIKPYSGKVYCVITEMDGTVIGDPDLFSDQHLAEIAEVIETKYYYYYSLSYSPEDHGIDLTPGTYRFHFYGEDYYETEEWLYSGVRGYI